MRIRFKRFELNDVRDLNLHDMYRIRRQVCCSKTTETRGLHAGFWDHPTSPPTVVKINRHFVRTAGVRPKTDWLFLQGVLRHQNRRGCHRPQDLRLLPAISSFRGNISRGIYEIPRDNASGRERSKVGMLERKQTNFKRDLWQGSVSNDSEKEGVDS
ncbi:hypothetical protein CEXT_490981 [Caerostris extrusa]|uniref:Uncharacterized protein n=1 Tax=Caerostris extrusa TaxID=172846 RepID=A0AAV4XMW5_CAEEX|nr:hypothetical protein CEXT_490981 [Caerostris extrusa]